MRYEELLSRIEDCVALSRDEKADTGHLFNFLEATVKRVRTEGLTDIPIPGEAGSIFDQADSLFEETDKMFKKMSRFMRRR